MNARVMCGIAANGYGQIVTIGAQLLSVPLLIRAWGPESYGAWVLLTAIPAALAFADGGLVVAGGNAIAMAVGRADFEQARALFHAVSRTVMKTVFGAAGVVVVVVSALPAAPLARVLSFVPDTPRLVLAALALVVLAGTLATVPSAALRADGRYALSVVASTTTRLAETMAILAVALAGGSIAAAALAWLAARLVGLAWLAAATMRRLDWLTPRPEHAALPSLRPLRAPALASLAMPAGFAICLQGVTIAVGLALSPVAVGLFAATRTLARAGVQLSGLVNHALMPEMARQAGRGNREAMKAVARSNTVSCVGLLALGWAGTVLFGAPVLAAWTGGRLQPDVVLLDITATGAALHGLWLGRANLMLAVNRQAACAWHFLVVSFAVAVLAWPVAATFGLRGVAALILIGEVMMVVRLWLPASRLHAPFLSMDGAPS